MFPKAQNKGKTVKYIVQNENQSLDESFPLSSLKELKMSTNEVNNSEIIKNDVVEFNYKDVNFKISDSLR